MTVDSQPDIVFLIDVDNTLLDNDRVVEDLRSHLDREVGPQSAQLYWTLFEALRSELGYADYLGALQRYRAATEIDTYGPTDNAQGLLRLSTFLIDYPFADRLYPGSLDVIRALDKFGPTVILSDGDVVFQPHKIVRSGLWQAVDGRVLIYRHKELMLGSVQKHYPARRYVLIDDKLRILAAVKQALQEKVVTVFPRQGHYAMDDAVLAAYPEADFSIDHIGEILQFDPHSLFAKSG